MLANYIAADGRHFSDEFSEALLGLKHNHNINNKQNIQNTSFIEKLTFNNVSKYMQHTV